jgi:branched-chain amino acid transport system ATP-binding protein
MLRLSNLHVNYAQIPALRGVNVDVNAGEIVALIGANGAGKSTTLKAISGLVSPSTGTIEFNGESVTGLVPEQLVERGIIHVPEGRRIFPRLTVEDNLRVGAFASRAPPVSSGRASASTHCFPALPNAAARLADRSAAANSKCWHLDEL